MSLSIYLECDECCEEHRHVFYDTNITHNLASMWQEAGCHHALYKSNGDYAISIIPSLENAITRMWEHPDVFRALEPSNKWGTYEIATGWLERLLDACRENPEARIKVSA